VNIQAADVVVNGISALIGGAVGGWLIAHRVGRWQQNMEDRIRAAELRLDKGDKPLDLIPVLDTRLDIVIKELQEIRRELREERERFVTKELCERRHEN